MEKLNTFIVKIAYRNFFISIRLVIFTFLLPMVALGQTLPTEFQKVELLTGLKNSVNFEFAPDGRIFILDRYGEVQIYDPATQITHSAGILDVFHDLEDGLLAIAFDPQFESNNYIYLHYSPLSSTVNRVSRFQMTGNVINFASEIILLEWATQRECCFHAAGDLAFDSQGNLFIATGDNTNHSAYSTLNENNINQSSENTSSNTNDLRGKILRIKPETNGTYSIPAGNLFPNGVGGLPEIYVMGARNPFKIFVDTAQSDWLYWGDVGPDANVPSNLGPEGLDEINLTKNAGNYGWPYFAGKNQPYLNTYANPDFYYDPNNPVNISRWNTGAVNLPPAIPSWLEFFHACYLPGPKYYFDPAITNPKKLPLAFDKAFFYYDFNSSKVWVVKTDANGNVLSTEQLIGSIVKGAGFIDLKVGPDGQLYILEYGAGCCPENTGTGKLIRIDYLGIDNNYTPQVNVSADVISGSVPLQVNFSSAGTIDLDGDPLTYEWDFESDGIVDSNEENPSFTYLQEGVYNALLRVNDMNGGINSKFIKIHAGNHAATFNFIYPPAGSMINWYDNINYDIVIEDQEDGSTANGTINCTDLNLVPSLGHLSHFHDDLAINQCEGTFFIDATGHNTDGQDDIFLVFNVNYTDGNGLTSFDQIVLHPKIIEAEFYDQHNNVSKVDNTDNLGGGTKSVRALAHNSYIVLEGRNLLNINAVSYRVASTLAGGTIEMRSGSSTGTILNTVQVPHTGGLNNWVNVESPITDPGGNHDLYIVFKNSPGATNLFDLNYIEFRGTGASVDNTPPSVFLTKALSSNQVSIKFSEPLNEASAENISNYSINNGVSISSVDLKDDRKTVVLNTSAIAPEVSHTLTISNIMNEGGVILTQNILQSFIFNGTLLAINSGGPALLVNGTNWSLDQYRTGGNTYGNGSLAIANTTSDKIYQTEAYGNMTYNIPVPQSGFYNLALHFAEIYHGVKNSNGIGARIFNVNIENGQHLLNNYDIFQRAGAAATAVVEEVNGINVSDGFLTITLAKVVDNAKISGIQVFAGEEEPTCPDAPFPLTWTEQNLGPVVPHRSVYIFSEDIDGDGLKDVVTGAWWYKNPGTPGGIWTRNVIGSPMNNMSLIHDFDNDGDLDIFGTRGTYTSAEMAWARNDGSGNFTIHTNIPAGTSTFVETFMAGAALGNFNGVANTQIAVVWNGAESSNSYVQMLTVPADPVNQNWTITSISPDSNGEAISAGDIDGDGDLDLFQGVNWLRNDNGSWTTFSTGITLPTHMDRSRLIDIDNNGKLDGIVTQIGINQEINWLEPSADPTQPWTKKTIGTDVDGGLSLDIKDIDFDGDLDIMTGEWREAHRLLAFENDLCNTGTWIKRVLHPGGTMDHHDGTQVVDIDNDGDLDIISMGWDVRIPRIYINESGIVSENLPPVLTNPGNKSYTLGAQVNLQLQATDPNQGDVLTYSASGLPAALSINPTTGLISGTLTAGVNTYPITITVTDQDGLSDQETFSITIGDGTATIVKIINSGGPAYSFNGKNWEEDQLFLGGKLHANASLSIAGTSNDELYRTERNDVFTYNIPVPSSGPYTVKLHFAEIYHGINNSKGVGARVFNVNVENGQAQLNNYDIIQSAGGPATAVVETLENITVNDGNLTIAFTKVVDRAKISGIEILTAGTTTNSPPVVTNPGNQLFTIGQSVNLQIEAEDPDGDVLTYSQTGLPPSLTLNSSTGLITGTIDGQVGEFPVTITVSDGDLNPQISFNINVDAGGTNASPILASIGNQNIVAGNSRNVLISASDPDGDIPVLTASNLPQFASFVDNNDGTGVLTLNPDLGDVGVYNMSITATDPGTLTDSENITINVTSGGDITTVNINSGGTAFVYEGVSWGADQYASGGSVYTRNIAIAGTLNDQLYQSERNHSTGFTYNIPVGSSGPFIVKLQFAELYHGISNGLGMGARVFTVNVENGQGQLNNYDIIQAAGATATAVTETLENITVNDGNLTITFTTIKDRAKISGIEISSEGSVSNSPPVLAAIGDQSLLEGESLNVNVSASDPNNDIPILSASGLPPFANFSDNNNGSGVLSLNPAIGDAGSYPVTMTATDPEGLADSENLTLTVSAQTTGPIYLINGGGGAFSFEGENWATDQYATGGIVYTKATLPISGTLNDQLYQSERNDVFTYNFPVTSTGPFTVNLHFAEIYHGVNNSKGVGARIFNVNVENGQGQLNNYDIIANAGGPAAAVVETFENITVNDGSLTITFSKIIDRAKISGIEILSGNQSASLNLPHRNLSEFSKTKIGTELDQEIIKLYPNPSNGLLFVELNLERDDKVTFKLYNELGREINLGLFNREKGFSKLELDLSSLPINSGLYYLKMEFETIDPYVSKIYINH